MLCRTSYYKKFPSNIPTYKNRTEEEKFFDEKLTRIKMSAKKRNISFCSMLSGKVLYEIWVKQKGVCYYSGVRMSLDKNEKLKLVSVDRKDSNLGYSEDNIVLCTYIFNSFKFSFSSEEIINFINELKSN
jgi:hypothetical protein